MSLAVKCHPFSPFHTVHGVLKTKILKWFAIPFSSGPHFVRTLHQHLVNTYVPWKKSYDQSRQHIKKQRHYFANKGPSSQSYGFSSSHVWIWELDQRFDAFEWCCWRRLLRVCWAARRSKPSILKAISPEYSMEGLMLKLKLQYFGHLILGKIEARRRRGWQRMRWLDGISDTMDMNLGKRLEA